MQKNRYMRPLQEWLHFRRDADALLVSQHRLSRLHGGLVGRMSMLGSLVYIIYYFRLLRFFASRLLPHRSALYPR